jgi:ferredoxin--NADP+ reductase
VRHSWELGYGSELIALQRICPDFAYLPTVSRPHLEHAEWPGHTGYVQHIWEKGILDQAWGFHPTPDDTHILMCGNPGMIEDMEKIIQAEGFEEHSARSPGQYHVEKYW